MNNLNPAEILMLDYVNSGLQCDKINFPGFWKYQYNSDPLEILKNLLKKKLIYKSVDIVTNLNSSKLPELKQFLKLHNLKVSGTKKELINLVLNNIPKEELLETFNAEFYKLTEPAITLLKSNEHIPYIHKHQNIGLSIFQAHEIKKRNPNLSGRDIALQFLISQSTINAKNNDWGLYRNCRSQIAQILIEETNFLDALPKLFEVCYIDVSGLGNGFNINYLNIYDKSFFPYEKSIYKLNDYHIDLILKSKCSLNISDDQLKSIYLDSISKLKLPFHLFTKDEVYELIRSQFSKDSTTQNHIYEVAEKRYRSNYNHTQNNHTVNKSKGLFSFFFKK